MPQARPEEGATAVAKGKVPVYPLEDHNETVFKANCHFAD
jgi:hypothetical protein